MAEVQQSTNSGEMAQRFIELVMMQAQQAALFLGRIPNPQTNKPEVNLDYARMFIDQLEMLQEKTRGNLSNEEQQVLSGVLADLRLAFVQATPGGSAASSPEPAPRSEAVEEKPQPAEEPSPAPAAESSSRKKFTKSYGS
jgi:hypothetical protein